MRRLLVAALVAASAFGAGAGTASAVCDPDYRPLCVSGCPGRLPDPKDPTDTSWLLTVCPDGASRGTECETAARCVGYCANQRFDAARAVSWTLQLADCLG